MLKRSRGILVTGSHRSGSTWVGKVIAKAPDVGFIDEPFSPRCRPGICSLPIRYWYTYVCEDNAKQFEAELQRALEFRYSVAREVRALASAKDIFRLGRDTINVPWQRLRMLRPLIKDPIAFFSSEWLARRFDLRVVILVRHPAAFAASLKRLGWAFDFNELLNQPLLMRDLLGAYEDSMREIMTRESTIVEQGALLWSILYDVARRFSQCHPDWYIVRHEDLSREPETQFAAMCDAVGLNMTPAMRKQIRITTSGEHAEAPVDRVHYHRRDSAATALSWKSKLDAPEIDVVRAIAGSTASHYYRDTEW